MTTTHLIGCTHSRDVFSPLFQSGNFPKNRNIHLRPHLRWGNMPDQNPPNSDLPKLLKRSRELKEQATRLLEESRDLDVLIEKALQHDNDQKAKTEQGAN